MAKTGSFIGSLGEYPVPHPIISNYTRFSQFPFSKQTHRRFAVQHDRSILSAIQHRADKEGEIGLNRCPPTDREYQLLRTGLVSEVSAQHKYNF
jgi:hypothetical protein